MAHSSSPGSTLYYRLRSSQRVIPAVAFMLVVAYEVVEHGLLAQPISPWVLTGQVLVYGVIGPILIFLMLRWLSQRVRERDGAEARLAALYDVSRQSASAIRREELEALALSIPERLGLTGAGAYLVAQRGPNQPWSLAGSRGLSAGQIMAVQTALARPWPKPDCQKCVNAGANPVPCLALQDMGPFPNWRVICLPLSQEFSRCSILGVSLPDVASLPAPVLETLESMRAGLTVALDRASFREREQELLSQIQRLVQSEQLGLVPTLEHILAEIAKEYPIAAGAVFLARAEGGRLEPIAHWPEPRVTALLTESAHVALGATLPSTPAANSPSPSLPVWRGDGVLAIPIAHQGDALGVLVLGSQSARSEPTEPGILGIVSSMMALLIRNSQLFARLEYRAVLEERNRLAREVHDGLAQSLGFLNIKAQHAQRLLASGRTTEAATALTELRNGTQEIHTEARLIIQGLRWAMGDQGSLADRLRDYGASFAARTGLSVTVEADPEPPLAPPAQLELFRVAQEALNNAHRHARARQISVSLTVKLDRVILTIEDDGIGFEPLLRRKGDHLGLRIMSERVHSIGGQLNIRSGPREGTTLRVWVPSSGAVKRAKEDPWKASAS